MSALCSACFKEYIVTKTGREVHTCTVTGKHHELIVYDSKTREIIYPK